MKLEKLASTEIAEYFRNLKRIRKNNPYRETFIHNGEIVDNAVGIPVKLLNKLLKEKHK